MDAPKRLQGKVAIVTGASKGIGAAIAKELAAHGAAVVVNYASSKKEADRIIAEITSKGGRALAVQGDVGKEEDVRRLFSETKKAYGSLDIVVNNAGVFPRALLPDVTEEMFHRTFNTNILGLIFCTREALNYFGPAGGSVINQSSVVSENPVKGFLIYSGTKGAIDTMTVELSRELGPRRIRVNAIAAGAVRTEGTESVYSGDFEKELIAQTPLGRIGEPIDVAKVAVFLASDDSSWLTGARILASGGLL
jgi:3-oxoacyl-[acyl-carrier protein] reductase